LHIFGESGDITKCSVVRLFVRAPCNWCYVGCAADVDDIKYVINFDYPNSSEDYVHRIGRTARASKRGTSYTFFTVANARQSKDLIEVLKEAKQQVNPKLMQLQGVASAFTGRCNLYLYVVFFCDLFYTVIHVRAFLFPFYV